MPGSFPYETSSSADQPGPYYIAIAQPDGTYKHMMSAQDPKRILFFATRDGALRRARRQLALVSYTIMTMYADEMVAA